MNLYHRTNRKAAEEILRSGFKEATGRYLTRKIWFGVWLSDVPLDGNEGASGDVLLRLKIPAKAVRQYEWKERQKPYREFLVPARVLNEQTKDIQAETVVCPGITKPTLLKAERISNEGARRV